MRLTRVLLLSELIAAAVLLQSFSELLEFFYTASQQTDVVSKPQVAKQSSSDKW